MACKRARNGYCLNYMHFYSSRVQTLIHFIAYTGTEAVVNRKVTKHSLAVVTELTEENVSCFFILSIDIVR